MMETSDSPLIYPAVKAAAAWLAGFAALLALVCAAGAVLEFALVAAAFAGDSTKTLQFALFAGDASLLCLRLLIVSLALLAPWCHQVLLAERGSFITGWLCWFGACIALPALASAVCAALASAPLLVGQDDLLLLILIILQASTLFNVPRMAAASLWQRTAIGAAPAILIIAFICGGIPLISTAFKVLAAALLFLPLRALRRFAPRIVGMPERPTQTPTQP